MSSKTKRITLVTGANRGLGHTTAVALARAGDHVIATGRSLAKLKAAFEPDLKQGLEFEFVELDVASAKSIADVVAYITSKHGKLDVLINNAGILADGGLNEGPETSALVVPAEKIIEAFTTNALGPYQLIQGLLPLMQKTGYGRIVNVSSGLGRLATMGDSWPGYRISKTAMNAITCIFAAIVKNQSDIKINAVSPGWVRTDMGGANAERSLEQGAASILWAANLDQTGPSGGFFADGKEMPW